MNYYNGTTQKKGRKILIPIVLFLVGFLIAVLIGNSLSKKAENVVVQSAETTEETQYRASEYPFTCAYAVTLNKTSSVVEGQDCCVPLTDKDGNLLYRSTVAKELGYDDDTLPELTTAISRISAKAEQVIGLFVPTTVTADSVLTRLDEIALIEEFYRAGGTGILLYGLPDDIDACTDYISLLRTVVGDCTVGAVLEENVTGTRVLALQQICNYCLLDMTKRDTSKEASLALSMYEYWRGEYDLRLLISPDDEDLALLLTDSGVSYAEYRSEEEEEQG